MPFESFTKKLGDAAKVAVKKSGNAVEITKLNMAISTEEDRLEKIFMEMGRKIYNQYIKGVETDEEMSLYCKQASEVESSIASMRKRIYELKNFNVCPSCGQKTELGTVFCPSCGNQIGSGQFAKQCNSQDTQRICPSCGSAVPADNDTMYCSSCGSKL